MFRLWLRFLIRNDHAVLAAAAVWAVAGLWAALQGPVDAVPDLSDNQVLVTVDWPGQNPPAIERQVTRPLSLALQGIPGVRTVRGSSDVGASLLHVIFDDNVSFTAARESVARHLAEHPVALPPGVMPRLAAEGIPTGQIFWYTVEGTGSDLASLRTLQDTAIAPQLRSVPGVAEVASVGGFIPEIAIVVNPAKLATERVSLTDVITALRQLTTTASGQVQQTATTELLVQVAAPDASSLSTAILPLPDGRRLSLAWVADIRMQPAPRRGVFEKDGSEVVAGIVHLRYGHNPLAVTRAVKRKLLELSASLPANIRLIPCYDRTPLIAGAIGTVTRTLLESLLVTTLCIVIVLRHWRTSLVIVCTLPLAILGSFLGIAALRAIGWADGQTNIMSLAGVVVSIGVLVDSSIVVAENVTHRLRQRFGDNPVTGDVSELVIDACATVAVPSCFAILIMVVSFLPVFALAGIDGRMYRPLAWTKTFALLSAAMLTVTLVPVLCNRLIRGRLREESESAIVRSVVGVYRPVLTFLMDRPLPLLMLLCGTLLFAAAATGNSLFLRAAVLLTLAMLWCGVASMGSRLGLTVGVLLTALIVPGWVRPLGLALRLPLDERMVMDMPITVPRISITQAADDLKARNMMLCRFPEVQMVMGKAGRADTPFDPAPLDMIETMVEFRPQSLWPRRRLLPEDAQRQARLIMAALMDAGLVERPQHMEALVTEVVESAMTRFEAVSREVAWQRIALLRADLARELPHLLAQSLLARWQQAGLLTRQLNGADSLGLASRLSPVDCQHLATNPQVEIVSRSVREIRQAAVETGLLNAIAAEPDLRSWSSRLSGRLASTAGWAAGTLADDLSELLQSTHLSRFQATVTSLNVELQRRAAGTWTQLVCAELVQRQPILDERLAATWRQIFAARYANGIAAATHHTGEHTALPPLSPLPMIDPHPVYDRLIERLTETFALRVWLWPHDAESLTRAGGELDRSVQMPGWANVWTRPIQNRVDMLATGVNSEIGIRVLGRDFDAVVQTSELIAAAVRELPGAADVIADPIRGKGYLEIVPSPVALETHGVTVSELQTWIAAATDGMVVGLVEAAGERRSLRLKVSTDERISGADLASLPIPTRSPSLAATVPLGSLAAVKLTDGPATIKSENGWLRNYVRLNVRERDASEFVATAKDAVQRRVNLAPGVFLEWTGQFEHAARTRQTMLWLAPVAVLLILVLLYATFHDWADAALMLLSVPGALAGGIVCQWLLGFPFTVAVGVGYIACFGMAAATSMVMLVYLREAVAVSGGLEKISLLELKDAVIRGAVHRLRPKLLTEAATLISLAPMLWNHGIGADVIQPMVAPVLGGILIADEVIDLLIPIAFYAVRRHRWQRLRRQPSSHNFEECFA